MPPGPLVCSCPILEVAAGPWLSWKTSLPLVLLALQNCSIAAWLGSASTASVPCRRELLAWWTVGSATRLGLALCSLLPMAAVNPIEWNRR